MILVVADSFIEVEKVYAMLFIGKWVAPRLPRRVRTIP
jgi:hypothetical protein